MSEICHSDLIADAKLKEKEEDMEERALGPKDDLEIDLKAVDIGLRKIKQFQSLVRSLTVEGSDYGVIPGTNKPTLLKPGAEKVAKLMNLADSYEVMSKTEDYEKPLFAYTIRCRLTNIKTERLISQGLGQCNSMESKYRFRWVFGSDVPEGINKDTLKSLTRWSKKTNKDYKVYRIDNDDIFSQINTILKMAKKRALVDAVLSAGRLSEIFTQDMEESATTRKPETSKGENKDGQQPKTAPPAPARPQGDMSEVLQFGKYKGNSLEQIWQKNPGYLTWLSGNAKEQGLRDRLLVFIDSKRDEGPPENYD